MDNAFVENNLLSKDFALLKISKYSQFLDRTGRDFREMLIARECITPNITYVGYLLGYDDENTRNISGGLFSDFEFLQASPKKGLEELIKDSCYTCKVLRL